MGDKVCGNCSSAIASGIYKIGENIYTDGTSLDITGPNAVPISEATSTWPVNVLPGTTTPAPSGHTGPTEPGTVTQTSTTTAQNTFRPGSTGSGSSSGPGASMTTTQKTETKTSITNNITNVTNIVNTETKTEDKPPEDSATDTPLAGIPELYKQKYPDGFSGVWNSFKTKFNQTPFVNLIHQLTPNIPSGGTCPAWTIDLSWTPGGSMGVYRLGDDYCFIWPILKIIIIITALFTARVWCLGADMGGMFTTLFAKIAAVVKWFGDLFVAIFASLWHILTDLGCWLLEQCLGVAFDAVSAIDPGPISGAIGAFDQLPAEMINILMLLGFGEAMGIIGAALLIRMGLQLIPFVRLGS